MKRSLIPVPANVAFRWHARLGAFERLAPPWESVEIVERMGGIEDGARVVIRMRTGVVWQRWIVEHRDYEEGRQFRDVQIAGPFTVWEHTHRIEPVGSGKARWCQLEDRIVYALPLGWLGCLCGRRFARTTLERVFRYRHTTAQQDLAAHDTYKEGASMKIAVTGASGLVGSVLVPFLATGGHRVVRLVRSAPQPGEDAVKWDPQAGQLDPASLEGVDAVVHLAGENIAAGRWTAEQKARIRDSRVKSTVLLCETLAKLSQPPKVLVCASAVGVYGNRGDEVLHEETASGKGFLADVCEAWEAATRSASQAGIRTALLRIGVVLSPAGGALAKMLLPFRMGVGGMMGSGNQYWSWIGVDDVVGAVHHALITDGLEGVVNVVAPQPVTNREFTKTLGRVLGRPTLFSLPGRAARFVLGEMADGLLLASTRVEPKKLVETAYTFRHSELEGALRHLLGR